MRFFLAGSFFWGLMISLNVQNAWGAPISWQLSGNFDWPRWRYDGIQGGKIDALNLNLMNAKRAQLAGDGASCLNHLSKAYPKGKGIRPWIALAQLDCAQFKSKNGSVSIKTLSTMIARVEAQPTWMLFGPWAKALKKSYVGALLAQTELILKSNRKLSWQNIDKLQTIKDWLTSAQRAQVYRWAGELAFIEQNLLGAQEFFVQSLNEQEAQDLRAKLNSLRQTLLAKSKNENPEVLDGNRVANPELGATEEEKKIYDRMQRSYQTQDYVSAIEDGVDLLQSFPGSARSAAAADLILDIYLSLSARKEEKFRHVRESLVKVMGKVDPARLYRWALNAYVKGNYLDALDLAEKSYAKYAGHPDSTEALLLAGKAAIASGEFADARRHLEKVTKEHGGTRAAAEATFRLGLIEYRLAKYSAASGFFERLLALPQSEDFEYRGLYWQWRAKQKLELDAKTTTDLLIQKYPLTYYGLRARFELSSETPLITKQKLPIKGELRLLDSDRLAWERLQVLLKAGWWDEAQGELDLMSVPSGGLDKVLWGSLWAESFRYDQTFMIVGDAIEQDVNLLTDAVLRLLYPKEFTKYILREAKRSGFHPDWIRSIIRQESSFRPEVMSSSNAIGAMQLLGPTASEIARDLKIKNFTVPESLMDPQINIRLGSTYMGRLVRSFSGSLPLALAAYNAGPGRMRRWLNSRSDLGKVEEQKSSSPDVEVWIDELPWEETSFYVKAILRNWMIYQWIYTTKVKFSDPIWVDASSRAR